MSGPAETVVQIESVRVNKIRESCGDLRNLSHSIANEGLRHPICLWRDGTLLSGGRRLRAYMLMRSSLIPARFVSTIEEAAKCLLQDNEDGYLSRPMLWSEVARLWDLMARLDIPAAAQRAEANRRHGVELRRATLAGKRTPGRRSNRGDNYFLTVVAPPFNTSEATASRIYAVWKIASGRVDATEEKRKLAVEVMANIDANGNVWANFKRLIGDRAAPPAAARKKAEPARREPAPAKQQTAAWARSLPQLEGLVAGLSELGPVNAELTWEQVGPVHVRLASVRRELEKIIRQMKETAHGVTGSS